MPVLQLRRSPRLTSSTYLTRGLFNVVERRQIGVSALPVQENELGKLDRFDKLKR
jgi:hypothetical protein